MPEPTTFGAWLRGRRKEGDLTQEALAERVGCSTEMIRKLEAGRTRPSRQLAELLVAALAVPAEEQAAVIQWARGSAPPAARPSAPPASPPPARPAGVAAPPTLPTGTVTFLFTDIEGSTTRWEQHPHPMRQALAQHDALVQAAIAAQGGVVFQTAGDSFAAAFPTAHAALAAALAAQRALQGAVWPEPIGPLRVRMALHTGPAEARADGWHAEQTLNRLARLLAAVHGGQVLLSGVTRQLLDEYLPPDVTLRDLGERRLKDVGDPLRVFQMVVPDLPAEFPPLKTLDRPAHNLPRQTAALIGRERETAAVATLLGQPQVALVTLTGPGGTGKTRLAVQVAATLLDNFTDGVWFVSLAPLTDPALVAPTIAGTLAIDEGSERPVLDSVQDYLRDKKVLLVLDNFEHLLAAAPQVEALLRVAPQLKVLATSRTPLHIYGEREFLVPPLTLPDRQHIPLLEQLSQYEAIQLFGERAEAVKPGFALTIENASAVVEICWRLDGLPLAIELAAARSKLFSPPALLARLEQRLPLLVGGWQDQPTRQQTLRNTIAWSYDLLSAGEQRLLRRLAVFQGGWTLDALEAVCNPGGDLGLDGVTGLSALVDKSLVVVREDFGGEPRFSLLETIHEYAQELLVTSGEAQTIRRNHLNYFLALAETAEPHLTTAQQVAWMDRLEEEQDNVRAVLTWVRQQGGADAQLLGSGLRFVAALWRFWRTRSYVREGRTQIAGLLAQPATATLPPALRAKALFAAAGLAHEHKDRREVAALAQESLQLSRAGGDRQGQARALILTGRATYLKGDYAATQAMYEESLTLAREVGDPHDIATALHSLGMMAEAHSDYATARALYGEALVIYRAQCSQWDIANALAGLASVSYSQGDDPSMRPLVEEMLTISRQIGDRSGVASALISKSFLACRQGDYLQEQALEEEALTIYRQIGEPSGIANALHSLGITAQLLGDYERGEQLLREGMALFRHLGNSKMVAYGLVHLGNGACAQQQWALAGRQYRESLPTLQALDDRRVISECFEGLAWVAQAEGQFIRAVRLFGAADALLHATGEKMEALEAQMHEAAEANVRRALDAGSFDMAWAEGQALTLDEAVAYALEQADPFAP